LITITLLAFLVLLLVSLATLTRVETQVADNFQKVSQARNNALFALNLALGQLQVYAGPDQRVTAIADLGNSSNGTATNGLAAAKNGTRHWTGVWGNRTSPSSAVGEVGLLNWLVSGNESVAVENDRTAAEFGRITSDVPSPPFTPSGPTPALADESDGMGALSAGGREWRLLVGGNSTDDVTGYVAAPLEDISVPASMIPGFAATDSTATPIGRYAWWVGDEGVKARANLLDPHATKTGAEQVDRGYSFVVAQRSALEWMDDAGGSNNLSGLHAAFDSRLPRVSMPAQLAMVSSNEQRMREAVKARMHDLSMYSYGVLADVAQGGLKKDLTRGLAAGAPSGTEMARGAAYAPPVQTAHIFTPGGADSYGVPRWGLLRSHANTRVSAGGAVSPQVPTDTQIGIGPVLTHIAVGFDFTSSAFPPESASTPQPIQLRVFPVVVLWNPYTVTLRGTDYVAGLGPRSAFNILLRDQASALKATLYMQAASFVPTLQQFWGFRIRCPDIPPGQSIVFTLRPADDGIAYVNGGTELHPGLNPAVSVVMDTGATVATPAEAIQNYSITTSTTAGEVDAVLAEYDPAGGAAAGFFPPSSFPRWYQSIQKLGPLGSSLPVMTGISLSSDTVVPRFMFRVQAGFSEAGSDAATNPQTGSQLQWVAHANFRGQIMARTRLDSWMSPSGVTGSNPSYAHRREAVTAWPAFNTLDARASAGFSLNNNGTPVDVSLWEFPSPTPGLLSLGQLQHANVGNLGSHPSYAIGNSLADTRVPRDQGFTDDAGSAPSSPSDLVKTNYDLSWNLNRALMDRFFFSTTPDLWGQSEVDSDEPLPNARLHFYRSAGGAPDINQLRSDGSVNSDPYNQAAANLIVAGGFNVNSTSAQAWRAVLGGVNQLDYDPQTRAVGKVLQAAFSRFAHPLDDDNPGDPWNGYRQLDEDQIGQLADNIVVEVRKRGPFLSLADFVNRRLVSATASDRETGLKGALQAAIDATATGPRSANDRDTAPFSDAAYRVSAKPAGSPWDLDHMRNDISNTNTAHRSRSAFAPKFLTQADILSTLAPVLAARSDTFVVRAYGESVNPLLAATDAGYITGRAWCEAVVQRLPDYVDSTDNNLSSLGAATMPADTGVINQVMGRRLKIVSFRWLTPADI